MMNKMSGHGVCAATLLVVAGVCGGCGSSPQGGGDPTTSVDDKLSPLCISSQGQYCGPQPPTITCEAAEWDNAQPFDVGLQRYYDCETPQFCTLQTSSFRETYFQTNCIRSVPASYIQEYAGSPIYAQFGGHYVRWQDPLCGGGACGQTGGPHT